jgi:hypothetical protein
MTERKTQYKTLDEIKIDIIKKVVTNSSPVSITRCYETLTGSLIPHSAGEDAPDGKFKIVY